MFALAAGILMVTEARRHNVKFVWAYIVGAVLIAGSVAFPLFLLARELRIGRSEPLNLRSVDTILLTVLAGAVLAFDGVGRRRLTDLQRAERRASGRGRTSILVPSWHLASAHGLTIRLNPWVRSLAAIRVVDARGGQAIRSLRLGSWSRLPTRYGTGTGSWLRRR
jgi:Terpene cyclase DEP1